MPHLAGLCLVLYHKHHTSARVRFARFGPTVIAAQLPMETDLPQHPGALVKQAAERLGLACGDIRIDPEFSADLLAPQGHFQVRLGEMTAIDPPFSAMEAIGGAFVALTELRGIPDTERDMMRSVYEHVLG
jgi:hypothetical protein